MDSSPIDLKKPGNNDVGICKCKSKNRGKIDPMQEMDPEINIDEFFQSTPGPRNSLKSTDKTLPTSTI